MKKAIFAFILIFALMFSLGACAKAKAPAPFRITLITPDDSPFWIRVDAGCWSALDEIGTNKIIYDWLYPVADGESIPPIDDLIAQAVDDGADILILANAEDVNRPAVLAALEKGVQVIGTGPFDNFVFELWMSYMKPLVTSDFLATITPNDEQAGKSAGEQLIQALAAKDITSGTIGLVDISRTVAIGAQKEGFSEAFEDSDFTVLNEPALRLPAGAELDPSTFVKAYLDAGVVALFGFDEADMLNIAEAVKGRSKMPVIGGFGGISTEILDFIDDDTIAFSVIADADSLGYQAMITAYAALTGGAAPERWVDSGVITVNKYNLSYFRPVVV